ncbi:unnamed protein product [Vitrella brassicaformis CCMP3155]|uniref:EF-hand domain-containing protein n=1 Tax=Vitrella brassicaformis (strain CCMP3155) TaxID=1169540 RepID=A0A0G4EBE6_VITBC|nr:unnamed protein product [Vitrella brassicaformis CCMP3155]|eukprot:CEL92831.1 unnamed protein product [Vitrella brassicaformis CCMP3155]
MKVLVPNYTIYGHTHARVPLKDKGAVLSEKPKEEWTRQPAIATRTQLLEKRRAETIPHPSFDIDRDGGVSGKDFFIAKCFDADRDGVLNEQEMQTCKQALNDGWLSKYQFGWDKMGSSRPYPVFQRQGVVQSLGELPDGKDTDPLGEVGQLCKLNEEGAGGCFPCSPLASFPPHPLSEKTPRHATRGDLIRQRKAEMQQTAEARAIKWEQEHPPLVPQPPAQQSDLKQEPTGVNPRQRLNAEKLSFRPRFGLSQLPAPLDPQREAEKERLECTTSTIPAAGRTRTECLEERRTQMRRQIEEATRAHEAALELIPAGGGVKQALGYSPPPPKEKTRSKLKEQQKCEQLAYNEAHFRPQAREIPGFTTSQNPWWRPASSPKPPLQEEPAPPAAAEEPSPPSPLFKPQPFQLAIEGAPIEPLAGGDESPAAGKRPSRLEPHEVHMKLKSSKAAPKRARKRWTSDLIEHANMKNGPRLFDAIVNKKATTFYSDVKPTYSSFSIGPRKTPGRLVGAGGALALTSAAMDVEKEARRSKHALLTEEDQKGHRGLPVTSIDEIADELDGTLRYLRKTPGFNMRPSISFKNITPSGSKPAFADHGAPEVGFTSPRSRLQHELIRPEELSPTAGVTEVQFQFPKIDLAKIRDAPPAGIDLPLHEKLAIKTSRTLGGSVTERLSSPGSRYEKRPASQGSSGASRASKASRGRRSGSRHGSRISSKMSAFKGTDTVRSGGFQRYEQLLGGSVGFGPARR